MGVRGLRSDNVVGYCYRHRKLLTKDKVKSKKFKCVQCHNAFRHRRKRHWWEMARDRFKVTCRK